MGENIDKKLYFFSFRPLIRQIERSWQAEERLRTAHNELELRVQSRTEELRIANSELEEKILERRRVEETLRETEKRSRRAEEIAHEMGGSTSHHADCCAPRSGWRHGNP